MTKAMTSPRPSTDWSTTQLARRQQLRTVVALRLFALLAQLALLGLAHQALGVKLPWSTLALIFSLLLGLNAITWVKLRQQQPIGAYEVASQLFADIAAFSFILYFTGGVTNPFVSLYLPLLGLAAALLPIRQVLALAVVSVLAYSVLMREYIPLLLANPADGVYFHLIGMWLNFLVSTLILVGFVARLSNELRQLEGALSHAQERLTSETRLAALGNQAASIAHQLGTPVSTIATVVADFQDDPALAHCGPELSTLMAQVHSIQDTLASLRQQVQASEAGDLTKAEVLMGPWLHKAVANWRNRHPTQEVLMQTTCLADPLAVGLRSDTLDLMLNALLDNAMQSQVRAGQQAPLQLSVSATGTEVRLVLRDNGAGFDAAVLPVLGQQPVRGHGQGMGLFLLVNLLQRQGAGVVFKNHAGGAEVVVTMPRLTR